MTARPTHVLVQMDAPCTVCDGSGRLETRRSNERVVDAFMSTLTKKPEQGAPTCAACIGTGKQIGRVTLENLRKVMK